MPASVKALAGFLTGLAEAGKKVVTIQRRAAAIAKAHQLAGAESPMTENKIKVPLKGIACEKKTRSKPALAFTLASTYFSPELATCPVRSLQAWLRASAEGRATGPVFVSLRKNEQLTSRRLTPEHINLIARRYLGNGYTANSLRASFVAVAKLNGADILGVPPGAASRQPGRRYSSVWPGNFYYNEDAHRRHPIPTNVNQAYAVEPARGHR